MSNSTIEEQVYARPLASSAEHSDRRDLWHSRPLDLHRWSEHPEVHSLIERLWTQHFVDFETNTGFQGRRPKGHPALQLRVLILNLYVAWKDDPSLNIGVSMSNSGYHTNSRYNALHISRVFIDLIRCAVRVGLVGIAAGSEWAGRTTRIWAEGPLIDLFMRAKISLLDICSYPNRETIVLSMGKGHWLPYEDNADIVQHRLIMQAYNDLIHTTFVDVPALENPIIVIPTSPLSKRRNQIQISQNQKFSNRIFYRGDWDFGGRIHGGFWQQMPKVWRPHIFINDLPTVEADYSGLHIAMLYGIEGKVLEGDAYTLDLPTTLAANEMRQLVKSLSLIAINAGSEVKAFQAFRQKQPTGSPLKRLTNEELSSVLNAFKDRHPAIAHHICSDMGVRLMAIDGRITTRIMGLFTRENVPVLTLFDSYVVNKSHADELGVAMRDALNAEVPGATTAIKGIPLSTDDFGKGADGSMVDIKNPSKILQPGLIETSGYKCRREAFFKWRYSHLN